MAGTWVDDPDNWSRAFQSTKPADVAVVHSKYWRSPHWTFEFEYFFEIAPNQELQEQLFSENKLRRITGEEAAKAKEHNSDAAPVWFAPKAASEYDIWVFDDEPNRNFRVLIDKKSGVVFLSDYQF
jgi:hypothetical protein